MPSPRLRRSETLAAPRLRWWRCIRPGSHLALAVLLVGLLGPTGLKAQDAELRGAQPEERTVEVGLYVSPPFVMQQNGRFTGMAMDLWEALASKLRLRSEYRVLPTIKELVDAVAAGDIDVAVTNLTITQKRAARIDFTQPWFDAGLRIMIGEDRGTGFWELISGLRDAGFLTAYAWLAFIIIAATVVLTLFDRRFDKDFPHRWRDGLAESFYAVMSVATSGRPPSRKNLFGWVGRIWSAFWLVCGIAVLAYVTSSVTSVMTTLSLTNQIHNIEDLPGKDIGVFTGSVAEEFAQREGLSSRSYADIDAAVAALRNGRIDAIIGDAPVLEYYAYTNPDAALDVVGPIFEPDKYGFALMRNSALTDPLTLELLGAHETDLVDDLRIKYFGEDP